MIMTMSVSLFVVCVLYAMVQWWNDAPAEGIGYYGFLVASWVSVTSIAIGIALN